MIGRTGAMNPRENTGRLSSPACGKGLGRLLLCALLCLTGAALGKGEQEASDLVARANQLYGGQKYEKAELLYKDAQKILPESPQVHFNLGNVAYRKGSYGDAEESYSKTLDSADAPRELRKKALYNLGNCAFKEGDKLLDSDLQKALESYRLSILRYQDVISRDELETARSGTKEDKTDKDAKFNIEVARLKIKDILDKLKQQEEQRKEQHKQQEEFIKKLQEAIKQQEEIVNDTGETEDRKKQGEDVSQSVEEIAKKQTENKETTGELSKELEQITQAAQSQSSGNSQSPPPADENAVAAKESLNNAEIEQGTALQHLDRKDLSDAKGAEETAVQHLQDALQKLTKPQPPQPQPGGQEQEKEQGREGQQKQEQPKPDQEKKGEDQAKMTPQEAQEELAKLRKETSEARQQMLEELRRRDPRYRPQRREYEPVDKDW
jgi:tetratricopeptide (TPR) repeat protein